MFSASSQCALWHNCRSRDFLQPVSLLFQVATTTSIICSSLMEATLHNLPLFPMYLRFASLLIRLSHEYLSVMLPRRSTAFSRGGRFTPREHPSPHFLQIICQLAIQTWMKLTLLLLFLHQTPSLHILAQGLTFHQSLVP